MNWNYFSGNRKIIGGKEEVISGTTRGPFEVRVQVDRKIVIVIFVYLSTLPEDGYLLRGIVQGYRTKLLRIPPGSLTCSAYSTVTRDLGLTSHPKDY